jgi:GTPase SAR1 family protein
MSGKAIGTEATAAFSQESEPGLPEAVVSESVDRIEIGTFVDYHRVLMGLLDDLDKMAGFARELNLNETGGLVTEMRQRLAQRRFNIAVVGEFKRGKSTFINALLGAAALPSDVLPCSATLNRVTYGIKKAARIEHHDGRIVDVPFTELADYITKLTPESEQRASTIKEAVVYFPTQYCANNVDVIDTPGLNDDDAMTKVTLSVLPQTDAAILVIMAQAPFSDSERDFLESKLLTSDLGRVIFVVNGIDLFRRREDTDRVVRHIEERIKSYVLDRAASQYGLESEDYKAYVRKIGRPRVFGLSATKALEAKLSGDQRMLEESRFDEFERELARFLTTSRGASTLQAPLGRLVCAAREIEYAISLNEGALQLAHDEFEKAQAESIANIEALRTRKRSELAEVNSRAVELRQEVMPLLASLPQEMLAIAERTVQESRIEPKELDDVDQLQRRIGQLVERDTRRAADARAEKITMLVERAVIEESVRLSEFAKSIREFPQTLSENFNLIHGESDFAHGSSGQAAAAASIAVFTGLFGIYTGYRDAGLKGASVGALASLGTGLAGLFVLSALTLPVSFPAIIVLGFLGILPTRWAVRGVFGEQRVERFRLRFKEELLGKMHKQLENIDLRAAVGDHIIATFDGLRDQVERETEAVLRDAETRLANLRADYERRSTLEEGRRRQFDEILTESQSIADRASRFSLQLAETMAI